MGSRKTGAFAQDESESQQGYNYILLFSILLTSTKNFQGTAGTTPRRIFLGFSSLLAKHKKARPPPHPLASFKEK